MMGGCYNTHMHKITPFLWFDTNLKEIVHYYLSIFPDAKVEEDGELSDTPSGDVEMATLTICGQELRLMTAGPMFKFNEAISFVIDCSSQEEVDYYWNKLTIDGGSEGQCGWCKDKYGLSWQVVPSALSDLMSQSNGEQRKAVTQAFLQMQKFDIAKLEEAFNCAK
jgi:predicted 3-demethylubiquinone-9 3-methyltransferase (glyoxalase superfamily)